MSFPSLKDQQPSLISSVPSGDRSANPASVLGCSGLQRALLSVVSAHKNVAEQRGLPPLRVSPEQLVRSSPISPPLQGTKLKKDDLRARISFQRDIRDCNILCLTETWLTPSVPDTAVRPSDNFSVLRMDRTAEAGKNKGGGVCFMINKKWCDPRNISILSRSCLPHLEHLSIICRPFYLPREFSSIVVTAVYIPPQADTSLALSKLHDVLSGYINKHPDAASIITGGL